MLKYNVEALRARRGEHALWATNSEVAASLTVQYGGSLSSREDVLKVSHEVNEYVNDEANLSASPSLDTVALHMTHDHEDEHERSVYQSSNTGTGISRDRHDNTLSSSKVGKECEGPQQRSSHDLN